MVLIASLVVEAQLALVTVVISAYRDIDSCAASYLGAFVPEPHLDRSERRMMEALFDLAAASISSFIPIITTKTELNA